MVAFACCVQSLTLAAGDLAHAEAGYRAPKYTRATLVEAAELANMPIITEFIAERCHVHAALLPPADTCTFTH